METTRVITDETSERISDKLQQVQLLQFIREKQPSEEDAIKIVSEETEKEGKEDANMYLPEAFNEAQELIDKARVRKGYV